MTERETRTPECIVADEQPVVREGLARMIGGPGGLRVLGSVGTPVETAAFAERTRADIAVIGFAVPGPGVGAIIEILAKSPGTRVLVFQDDPDGTLGARAAAAGASGVCHRSADAEVLLHSIWAALGSPGPTEAGEAPARRSAGSAVVSPREHQVLQLLAEGLSNRQISDRLVVSVETVKTHVRNILGKLGAESRAQAVAVALRRDLIR